MRSESSSSAKLYNKDEKKDNRRKSPRLLKTLSINRYAIPGTIFNKCSNGRNGDSGGDSYLFKVYKNPDNLRNQCVKLSINTLAHSYIRNIIKYDYNDDNLLLPSWNKINNKKDKIKGSCFGDALAEGAYYTFNDTNIIIPLKVWSYYGNSYPISTGNISLLIRRTLINTNCGIAVGVRKHINDNRHGIYYNIKDTYNHNNTTTKQEQEQQHHEEEQNNDLLIYRNILLKKGQQGQHAFVIVGFEINNNIPGGGVFLFIDNNGINWGHRGYGLCSFSFIDNNVDDIAQVMVNNNNMLLLTSVDDVHHHDGIINNNTLPFPIYQCWYDKYDRYHVKCCKCPSNCCLDHHHDDDDDDSSSKCNTTTTAVTAAAAAKDRQQQQHIIPHCNCIACCS